MKLAGSSLLYTRFDFETACRQLADLGFERVDIAAIEGWAHIDPSTVVNAIEETAERIETIRDDTGLEPIAFNANPGVTSVDEQARRMEALARVGETVGVEVATVSPASLDEPLEEDLDRFRALVEAVDPYDFTLAVEGHRGMHTEDPEIAREYVESIPDLRFTLDPGHYAVGEYWKEGDGYAALLPYVAHVHLRRAAYGEIQVLDAPGVVDFANVIGKLRDVGYDGALSIEYVDSLDDTNPNAVERNAETLREEIATLLSSY